MASGTRVYDIRPTSMGSTGSAPNCPSSPNVCNARLIRNGIVNTVITLVIADSVTQSGTSARAANEYAFDVTPLGQAATMTKPTAMNGGTSNSIARANAVSGCPASC